MQKATGKTDSTKPLVEKAQPNWRVEKCREKNNMVEEMESEKKS
jgi:hypothetical protein